MAEQLRSKKISCSITYSRLSKALEYANSKKIPYVVILGEKEAKLGKYRLRNMSSGKEKLVPIKSLIKELR